MMKIYESIYYIYAKQSNKLNSVFHEIYTNIEKPFLSLC